MDYIEDDYLTNLSWLKLSNHIRCSNNSTDDELQCLCWIMKLRPHAYSSHSLKRLSSSIHNDKHSCKSNRLTNDCATPNRILMVRTLNNRMPMEQFSQQSLVFIRSSNDKILCLSIRHFNE
ncbi:unnamed protein product [Adineta ricciae]|uniref:Uncharacterized protein n=1 Tax=Adineta ricciae TaxID=249248 RepID=A0A813MJ07_ADIRI|nr:unnamed protein product [Adineta ricciae]CAF1302928.1 unnamed protein product [Adineta ricciae]